MSTVWFISDLHIGHSKVASHRADEAGITRTMVRNDCGLYEADPEFDVRWHDTSLAEHWDAVVGRDDVVHVLGDISSGTDKAQRNALEWLSERPGRKRLKYGNHDGPHDMNRDSAKYWRMYAESEVFEDMRLHGRMRIPLSHGHAEVLLSHFPYVGDRGPDRHTQWRLPNEGLPIIHGHTHSQERVSYGTSLPTDEPGGWFRPVQINVAPEAWDRHPVHISEISAILQYEKV